MESCHYGHQPRRSRLHYGLAYAGRGIDVSGDAADD